VPFPQQQQHQLRQVCLAVPHLLLLLLLPAVLPLLLPPPPLLLCRWSELAFEAARTRWV
jgi:hypothetical protein